MSTSRHIDKICLAAVALTLVLTILLLCGGSLGLSAAAKTVKYESTLFDTSYVHKIDIVMNDWDSFIEGCENEEYASCTVAVDGKKHANIAIRAKGNTSLSSVRSMGSRRYSFKLEFDHYEAGKSLDGLDKLCLNNLIQDNTMMKDYLVYRMMGDFGADAPLCAFAWLTVNGEDWGLYLAVEGVEDSFLARNYGSDAGELYKPDSMNFGGGRGNGKDFNFDELDFDADSGGDGRQGRPQGGFPGGQLPGQPGEGQAGGFPNESGFPGRGGFPNEDGAPGGPGGGMGSDDVKLKYIDDDPDSYANIFDSAKTDVSDADQARLIAALKQLSSYTDLEDVLDMDEVLRYFVVHNFVVNGDSYTGGMIHNYYLHEKDGKLGMIPWDYNLAFGAFQGGNASASVNAAIDSPVTGGNADDRPMVGWIFSDERYTERYHALFGAFLDRWFSGGELETLIGETAALIRPWVEKDPTKFCTTEEFDAGAAALSAFVSLRGEAVRRQLAGDETPVETGTLTISAMGSMGGRGGPGEGGFPDSRTPSSPDGGGQTPMPPDGENQLPTPPGGEGQMPTFPDGDGQMPTFPEGGENQMPTPPDGDGQMPTPPGGNGQMPTFPDGDGQMPTFPDGDGQMPTFPEGGENQMPTPPGGESNRGRPQSPGGSGLSPTAGTSGSAAKTWLLLGVSALALALGLLIAGKKKY